MTPTTSQQRAASIPAPPPGMYTRTPAPAPVGTPAPEGKCGHTGPLRRRALPAAHRLPAALNGHGARLTLSPRGGRVRPAPGCARRDKAAAAPGGRDTVWDTLGRTRPLTHAAPAPRSEAPPPRGCQPAALAAAAVPALPCPAGREGTSGAGGIRTALPPVPAPAPTHLSAAQVPADPQQEVRGAQAPVGGGRPRAGAASGPGRAG